MTPEAVPPRPWLTECRYWLDALDGGVLTALDNLAHSPPTDPAELFEALAAVQHRLSRPGETDILRGATELAEGRMRAMAGAAGSTAAMLVQSLWQAADRALQAGANDPADPWVRLADFEYTSPFQGHVGGLVGYLPEGHAARAVEPIHSGGVDGAWVVLLLPDVPFQRLSSVRANTDNARDARRREDEAKRAREEYQERERLARESRNSPEIRLAAIEAELARLRAGTVGATP
jgi:hypothetical protein